MFTEDPTRYTKSPSHDIAVKMREAMDMAMYDYISPGQVFVAVKNFGLEECVWRGTPEPDPDCPAPWGCAKCSGEEWTTHCIEKEDILMFVAHAKDEDEIEYEWLWTNRGTGHTKVIKGLIMGFEIALFADYYKLLEDNEQDGNGTIGICGDNGVSK